MLDRVVLGCGNFGGIGSAPEFFGQGENEERAFELMDAAWALGIRRFDTADAYGGGRSETAIGKWLAATGNRPAITTKTYNPMAFGADRGLGRERVLRQLEASLERLGLDSVDLYLAHEFDPETPLCETLEVFEELAEGGRIGAYGVSNFDGLQLEEACRLGRPAVVQNSYSLLDRAAETDVLPVCERNGVAFQAFGPLAGGWLTGKYRRGEPRPAGSRMTQRPEPYLGYERDRAYDGLDGLRRIADGRGVSMAGIALAWLLADPRVDVVVGPRRPAHLEPVREAISLELGADERAELDVLFPA